MQVYTFEATYHGDGMETDSIAVSAANLTDARTAAAVIINGVNSFADCLIGLDLLFITPDQD